MDNSQRPSCSIETGVEHERFWRVEVDEVDYFLVDRDALLALADEMGRVRSKCDFCIKKGDCDWADETVCLESRIDDYAQRIREALGAGL